MSAWARNRSRRRAGSPRPTCATPQPLSSSRGNNPYPPCLLWWYCYDTGLIHRVESVHCGARDSQPDAERDARKWAELPGQDDPDFAVAAIGTFDEFDALVGEGFVTYTLGVAPDPIEAPALDLWEFLTTTTEGPSL
jgi:hypothetical protein